MSKHICFKCKYQYFMLYNLKLKCMNEESNRYGEDVEPTESCEKWVDMQKEIKYE